MLPEVVKYRLWNLALRMNPQTAVYGVRVSSSTVGVPDTFVNYNLLRVTYRELTTQELMLARANLQDVFGVWTIYQVDLDQAGAPLPSISNTLSFADGSAWTIEKVTNAPLLGTAYACTCRRQPLAAANPMP